MFKILIIDDSMEKTNSLIKCIEEEHFQEVHVDYELEVRKACKLLTNQYFDLLILDIQLPSIEGSCNVKVDGGVDILRRISELETIKRPMSIIGLTAFDENYEKVEKAFNERLFHLIKYDRNNESWKKKILKKIDYLIKAKRDARLSMANSNDATIDCAIITAVSVEFEAVKTIPLKWKEIHIKNDPVVYFRGELTSNNKTISIILAKQDNMGLVSAAELTTKIIKSFNPSLVAMVGIAAGREGEVALGDILVASESWNYGSGKIIETDNGAYKMEFDSKHVAIKQVLINFFNAIQPEILYTIRREWNDRTMEDKREDIKVVVGPVVSGTAVVQNARLVKEYIIPQNRKVKGLDMETYAVYHAAESTSIVPPYYLSMKAVSDYADMKKNDGYQKYAAYVSANLFVKILPDLMDIVNGSM